MNWASFTRLHKCSHIEIPGEREQTIFEELSWQNQGQHVLIVVELIEGLYLIARDDHVVEDQVVDQPVFHPPQDLRHVLDPVENAPGGNCYILQARLVK